MVYMAGKSGEYNILGRRVPTDGAPVEAALTIIKGPDQESWNPSLAMDLVSGNAYVVWSHDNGAVTDIKGRLVEDDDTRGTVYTISDTVLNDVWLTVTVNPENSPYLVAWSSPYVDYDVYTRWVHLDGSSSLYYFLVDDDDDSHQWNPETAFGSDHYLVAYEDTSGPSTDIFGRIGSSIYPQLALPVVFK